MPMLSRRGTSKTPTRRVAFGLPVGAVRISVRIRFDGYRGGCVPQPDSAPMLEIDRNNAMRVAPGEIDGDERWRDLKNAARHDDSIAEAARPAAHDRDAAMPRCRDAAMPRCAWRGERRVRV
ncbi:hypothetical protein [Burkholderia savannae]|uniref:hypothetical protein n=1 Tax=Burkholderia savannae TaxID=1637837 RepID=UPI000A761678|nr:hypothetical protein [Burkholderia savannae]